MIDDHLNSAGADASAFGSLLDELLRETTSGRLLALLVVQIDEFNRIGSTLGREAGADLHSSFEAILREAAGPKARVACLGERKFAVVLLDRSDDQQVMSDAEQILKRSRPKMWVGRSHLFVDTIIGVAIYPQHAGVSDELLRRAELGLLAARKSGSPLELYQPDSTLQVASIWLLESELETAVKERRLEVHYQPKIRVGDGNTAGIEALLRWFNPAKGYVPPETFVAIAERTGLIEPLTRLTLEATVEHVQQWPSGRDVLDVAVNITPSLLRSPELIAQAARCADQLSIYRATLTLEITESAFMDDPEACLQALNTLRSHDIRIAIDDFGAGFSSLGYLKQIPAQELKIDRSFVQNMTSNAADRHIVRSVVELAHGFDMDVVAEGVEDEACFEAVRAAGCDVAQGFFVTQALSASDIGEWLAQHPPAAAVESGRAETGRPRRSTRSASVRRRRHSKRR